MVKDHIFTFIKNSNYSKINLHLFIYLHTVLVNATVKCLLLSSSFNDDATTNKMLSSSSDKRSSKIRKAGEIEIRIRAILKTKNVQTVP